MPMRVMVKDGVELRIVEHIILKNMWEYYVTDFQPDPEQPDVIHALVMGFETEMGDVYLPEIKPYIISRTKDLHTIFPAEGWRWKDQV